MGIIEQKMETTTMGYIGFRFRSSNDAQADFLEAKCEEIDIDKKVVKCPGCILLILGWGLSPKPSRH